MPEYTAFSGLHAVVAEDSLHMRALLRSMLRALGFAQVTVETNGADALAVIKTGWPDVVLLDWNMPGLSGIDVARSIRALPDPLCRIPIMMVTAHASPQRLALSRSVGVNNFLCKPVSINALERRLQKIIDDPLLVHKPDPAPPARRKKKAIPDPDLEAGPVNPNKNEEDAEVETFYV